MGSGTVSCKVAFLQAMKGEMAVKKTSRDPALTLRDILIKMRTFG